MLGGRLRRKGGTLKKAFAFLLMIYTCLFLFSQENTLGIITDNDVRFRDTPSLKSEVLLKFSKDTEVNVLGYDKTFYNENGKIYVWINVEYNKTIGWVSSNYLKSNLKLLFNSSDIKLGSIAVNRYYQYQRDVLCITKNARLYNAKMTFVGTLGKGEKAISLADDYPDIPESFKTYINNCILLQNGVLISLSVIKYLNDYYIIDNKDISWMSITDGNALYYLKNDFHYNEVDYDDKGVKLAFAPVDEILIEINGIVLTQIVFSSEIHDTYLAFSTIKGFNVYKNIIAVLVEQRGGRYLGGGAFNEKIEIYEYDKGIYKKASEKLIAHGES